MLKTVDDVAQELATAHRREDPETRAVYFYRSEDDVIRLVEISDSADSGGEVLPFWFNPDDEHGVPYPSVLILLSPEDWDRIQRKELSLPKGWDDMQRVQLH